jgi:D-glycero-D-manno-heptose 1,7-bisphosphate phosphatase
MSPGRKAVFLDRDGVLNQAVVRDGVSHPPADAESMVLCPDAAEAVVRLKAAGYLCVCVTNQPDVARGTRTRANVEAMNARVMREIPLDDIHTCFHDNADHCDCRKPKPGMLLAAIAKWGIDPAASWMIGDRDTDVMAGRAAGCRTILVASRYDAAHSQLPGNPGSVCRDLLAAVHYILSGVSFPAIPSNDNP